MKILDLIVLGFFWKQEGHGYLLKQRLTEVPRGWWDELLPGAWYHHLNRLTEEGYLLGSAPVQEGKRPPKRTYRLSHAGERYLVDLLQKSYSCALDEWGLVVAFLGILTPSEQVKLLEERLAYLKDIKLPAAPMALAGWSEGLRRLQTRWINDYLGKLAPTF